MIVTLLELVKDKQLEHYLKLQCSTAEQLSGFG